jgi:hypothetical protein
MQKIAGIYRSSFTRTLTVYEHGTNFLAKTLPNSAWNDWVDTQHLGIQADDLRQSKPMSKNPATIAQAALHLEEQYLSASAMGDTLAGDLQTAAMLGADVALIYQSDLANAANLPALQAFTSGAYGGGSGGGGPVPTPTPVPTSVPTPTPTTSGQPTPTPTSTTTPTPGPSGTPSPVPNPPGATQLLNLVDQYVPGKQANTYTFTVTSGNETLFQLAWVGTSRLDIQVYRGGTMAFGTKASTSPKSVTANLAPGSYVMHIYNGGDLPAVFNLLLTQ